MRLIPSLVRLWARLSLLLVLAVIAFLFGYVFYRGGSVISVAFLTEAPKGAILGMEGGIFPAIVGSFCFTGVAVLLALFPALATALYLVFYCRNGRIGRMLRLVVQCIAGIPSIVLGLFAYSLLVRELNLGRCVLSAACALAVMILPFLEVRMEKSFREVPARLLQASDALGCSRRYTILHIVLPECRGELVSGVLLGGCYAMGATAPLMFTGGVAYAGVPESLLSPAMALPLHLYLLVAQGATSLDTAYGTALVMMVLLLASSLLANLFAVRRR